MGRQAIASVPANKHYFGTVADFIAAANPDTVELLLARIRDLETGLSKTHGIKPLEWDEPSKATNQCWVARTVLGTYSVCFEDGWYAVLEDGATCWEWDPEQDPRSYHGPHAAQTACRAHYESTLKQALIEA